MRETLEPSFIAQKIAACTLAALRLHAVDSSEEKAILSAWDAARFVIEANMAGVIWRRDKAQKAERQLQDEEDEPGQA